MPRVKSDAVYAACERVMCQDEEREMSCEKVEWCVLKDGQCVAAARWNSQPDVE